MIKEIGIWQYGRCPTYKGVQPLCTAKEVGGQESSRRLYRLSIKDSKKLTVCKDVQALL